MVLADAWMASGTPVRAISALEAAKAWEQVPAEKYVRLQALALARERANQPTAAAAAQEAAELAAREPSLAPQRPASIAFVAELLTRLGQRDAAADWFARNLVADSPLDYQRNATLQLAKLRLDLGDLSGARQRLEGFLAAQPVDSDGLRLHLLLGQIVFRQYQLARAQTNLAEAAAFLNLSGTQFRQVFTNTNLPELQGPAALGRGWCLWEEGLLGVSTNRLAEAETNFLAAACLLSPGEDQARAWFKAGDCQLSLGGAVEALASYRKVLEPERGASIPTDLQESAWRQQVVAAAQLKDRATVLLARERLVSLSPKSEAAVRSTLLAGQVLTRVGDPEAAHDLLDSFLKQVPDSPFRPEVELALAAANLRAQRWTNAISELDSWIAANTNSPEMPRAMWDRAWASAQARLMTNAAAEFARLAALYPTAPSAGVAQLWLAEDFFNRREFDRAGLACNLLLTNEAWRGKPEWYRAKFLAAESARRLENWRSAGVLLFELLNDKETPPALFPATYFALGEYHLGRPPEPNQPVDAPYDSALEAFRKVQSYTNSPLSPAALGWMANCYLQKAGRATNFFATALDLYSQVLHLDTADSAVRANAAFGLAQTAQLWADKLAAAGSVTEARELRLTAVNRLLDLVHGKLLRPGEASDPSVVEKGGRLAGDLLEELGRGADAARLYVWLADELTAQKAAWEQKAIQARGNRGN